MEISWSLWLLVPIAGIVIALIWTLFVPDWDLILPIWGAFAWRQLVLIAIVHVFTLGGPAIVPDEQTQIWRADTCTLAQNMGLTSDQTYPIKTGSRMGGTQGEGYFWSGVFSQRGSVKLNPGSALSIGFDYGGMSSIFDIPTSQIVFIKDPAATQPTMKLKLKCASTKTEAKQLVYYAPPRVKMESLILVTVRDEVRRGELMIDPANKQAGLSPLVSGNVDFVQIRLTPELYDEILGG